MSSWFDYEVEESDSLQTIAIKVLKDFKKIQTCNNGDLQFDAPVSSLKSKNRISDSSDLWTGRIIKVPADENADQVKKINERSEHESIDETPETIGFVKVYFFFYSKLLEVLIIWRCMLRSDVNGVHVVH